MSDVAPAGTRFFGTLATIALVTCLAALIVPDLGGLGPPPTVSDALDWVIAAVQSPFFFGPMAGAISLYAFSKTRPLPQARLRSQTHLPEVSKGLSKPQLLVTTRKQLDKQTAGADGQVLAELIVHAGVRLLASDLHLQPSAASTQVSARVDGSLEPLCQLDPQQYAQVVNRLKVLAKLMHYVTEKPQDGQFELETPDGTAHVRLSLLPTHHGEKAVMRLAGLGNEAPRFEDLNLPESVRQQLVRVLEKPQGLIFFTGPTGSGKTTSIYASVSQLQQTRGALAQIATIEDPIETTLQGVAQTQVNRVAGLDFAAGLRAVLRQDPNVLVVGEIRDNETAKIATQAALTGHLILTTVHASSSVGVFNRLLEMGVEPSVLSSVALASFSQRLLRRLCPHCRKGQEPSDEQLTRLTAMGEQPTGYFESHGCNECGGTGVLGRAAVFEVMVVTDEIRESLRNNPSMQDLMAVATRQGLEPMRVGTLRAARNGDVSLAEALRVIE